MTPIELAVDCNEAGGKADRDDKDPIGTDLNHVEERVSVMIRVEVTVGA
jgi:hypothetical protein